MFIIQYNSPKIKIETPKKTGNLLLLCIESFSSTKLREKITAKAIMGNKIQPIGYWKRKAAILFTSMKFPLKFNAINVKMKSIVQTPYIIKKLPLIFMQKSPPTTFWTQNT